MDGTKKGEERVIASKGEMWKKGLAQGTFRVRIEKEPIEGKKKTVPEGDHRGKSSMARKGMAQNSSGGVVGGKNRPPE